MAELEREYVVERRTPGWLAGLAVAGVVLSLGALGWALGLQNHLNATEANLTNATQQNAALSQKLDETNERMRAQAQTLGQSVGLTQRQLEEKSDQLIAQERATAGVATKLQKEQTETAKQVGAVQTDVSNVKTDVSGVKSDVASTQADVQATKSQLSRTNGDMGMMSGLIATNHDQLEELKHRGDRNYYEFTLTKGAPAQNVGTIKVGLKKVDPKRSKFTLALSSDDKNIEKKDKNLDEPIQFYSGKTPALFEIVVNNITKNQVTGYLSAPKNAPAPFNPAGE
jgi:chromosome segregation ATPase